MVKSLLYFIQFTDREILFYFNGLMTGNFWFREIVYLIARFGVAIFIFVGVYLWFRKSPKDKKGFFNIANRENRQAVIFALLSLAVGFTIDWIISTVFPRQRPFLTYPDLVKNLPLTIDLTSFPSRHAMAVFALATSIWLSHLWHFRNWGIFLFFTALLIALSRVAAGVHYPSDIIGGMIVGVFSAWVIHENNDWIKRRVFHEFKAGDDK